MLVACVLALVAAWCALRRWRLRAVHRLGRQLSSGLTSLPLLGHGYLFFGDNENLMSGLQTFGHCAINKENGLCSLWMGSKLYTVIADPETAELVLKTSLEKDDVMKMATLFSGNGSIFAPVSIWRRRRKVLIPTFGTKNMKGFLSIFNKQSEVLVQQLDKQAGSGTLSAWKYYTAYTMDSIAEATLGYQMHAQKDAAHPFLLAFDEGLKQAAKRLLSPWLHSNVVYHNLPIYRKLLAMKNFMWSFIYELIEEKRKEMNDRTVSNNQIENRVPTERLQTFLELLIRSSGGEDGYTDVEITEELIVIMVAGNDTSAVGSSFVTLMLASHPEVQEKVFKELRDVFGDSDRSITSEDLPRLKYLDAVIKETLRLYPPVPVITRKIEHDTTLPSGIKLVAGTGAVIHTWAIHRNPRYWGDDAEQFRPERFLELSLKHPAAFIPFSYGPRNCVGYQFAMTSMKTVLSTVLRRYKILPAGNSAYHPHQPLRLKFDLMMKDVNGFQIQLERRSIR